MDTHYFDWISLIDRSVFVWMAAVLGLFMGSFFNVCADRYVTGESVLWPPSHCPHCQHRLRPWELIPVLSFVLLRGRCSQCRSAIGWAYPLMEIVTALLSAALAWRFGPSWQWLVYFAFTGLFLIASAIDLRVFLLPDRLTLGGAVLALPCALFVLERSWISSVAGALIGAGVFWLLMVAYRKRRGVEGLGFGDVKLMLSIGLLCGVEQLSLVILLAALGALLAFAGIKLLRGGAIGQVRLPFGPFLCAAAWLSWMFGDAILWWWIGVMSR